MLNDTYLAERASLIDLTKDMGHAPPGVPPGTFDLTAGQQKNPESGTSHISIVDQYGNALSMTTTVENYFGSGLMVGGFLLNNQLTDFSFEHVDARTGVPVANRVQPKKRPRSSMSPTLVFDSHSHKLTYVAGSPGGSRIIGYTGQALVAMLDYGVDPQTVANTPYYQNRNGRTEIERPIAGLTADYDVTLLVASLEAMGHTVVDSAGEESGLSLIQVVGGGLLGGADPRRDGTAGGRATFHHNQTESSEDETIAG